MRTWKTKDGTKRYQLPNCDLCGRRSNTTDKQTAQDSFRFSRTCRACREKIRSTKPLWRKCWDWIK